MKKTLRIVAILLGTLFVFGGIGCHKNSASAKGTKSMAEGMADLRLALATANPEVQSNLYHGVTFSIRYGDFAKASSTLQLMAGDASLNDQQKKAVNDANDLIKQAMANAQSSAPPAK